MKLKSTILLVWFFTLSSSLACAQFSSGMIIRGEGPDESLELEELVQQIPKGSIIILSEVHNLLEHHQNHQAFFKAIQDDRRTPLTIALEFLSFTDQDLVDQYQQGLLTPAEFKEAVNFGADFPWYNDKMVAAFKSDGRVIAANAPRTLSSKIARQGIEGLNEEELKLLPPAFELGSPLYRQRFEEIMSGGGHTLPPQAMDNYFAAQSLWDDTMAYQIIKKRAQSPEGEIILIVGDFHASYGGGTKDRLVARGVPPEEIVTISQVQIRGLSDHEIRALVFPDSRFGVRADYIWLSDSDVLPPRELKERVK